MPLVSVVIPTRNRLSMLTECVESVKKQTLTEWEIIICDNNSSDDTSSIAKQWTATDQRIRYLKSKTSLGMVQNWNRGIRQARGMYVALLMDDDVWEPTFLEATTAVLRKKTKVGVVAVQPVPWYEKGAKKIYPLNHYQQFTTDTELEGIKCIEYFLKREWRVGLPSAVITRKRCFKEVGLFKEPGIDPEMWLRILVHYRFYYLNQRLTKWRIHNQGSYTDGSKKSPLHNSLILMQVMQEVYGYLDKSTQVILSAIKQQSFSELLKESGRLFTGLSFRDKLTNIPAIIKIYLYGKNYIS